MRLPGMYEQMTITVRKDELLEKLEENRRKHHTVFEDAMRGYTQTAEELLQEHLNAIRKGKIPAFPILLTRPEDHTRDYDRVIGMLRMHQGDTFEIDEQTYQQYVDDDWNWKRQWLETSAQYAAGSVQANYKVQ